MTPQHTRNVVGRAAYPSNAVDDSNLQHRGYDRQYSLSIPSHHIEGTRNQRQNNPSRPNYSWRYPPLSERGFRRPIFPTIEYSNQSHQLVSHPAPGFPVSNLTLESRYRPYVRRSAFPGARRDMRNVDRPFNATIASSYLAPPPPLSVMSTSNVELSRRSLINPPPTHWTSRREEYNMQKDIEGNVNEAFHRPWLQNAVSRMDPYILRHPIQSRTALTPLPADVSQLMASLLSGDPLASLKRLERVDYLDIYPSPDRMSSSEPARSTMYRREVQREFAYCMAIEFDEYCLFKKPMQPFTRFLIRTEAGVLGRAVFHSRDAALHILTGPGGWTGCPYHIDIIKSPDIERAPDLHGAQVYQTPRRSGKLDCGCSEDDVILELMLRKITIMQAGTEIIQGVLSPQARSFVVALFRTWTGLDVVDFFRRMNDLRIEHRRDDP